MTPAAYIATIVTMENQNTDAIRERMIDTRMIRMLHAAIGMCTETGEIQGELKKALIYDKPLEYEKLLLELGDLMWYVGLMCNVLEVSLEQIMDMNIAKLRKRYPDGYSHERATHRDTDKEHPVEILRDIASTPRFQEYMGATGVDHESFDKAKAILDQKVTEAEGYDIHSHYKREGGD